MVYVVIDKAIDLTNIRVDGPSAIQMLKTTVYDERWAELHGIRCLVTLEGVSSVLSYLWEIIWAGLISGTRRTRWERRDHYQGLRYLVQYIQVLEGLHNVDSDWKSTNFMDKLQC